jgi:small conductance mechanosensitive channel
MAGAAALRPFEAFTQQAAHYAPKLALAALVLLAGALLVRMLRAAVRLALRRTRMRSSTVQLAARTVGIGGWVLVISVVLSTLQLQAIVLGISGVLALMGAAFVASASATSNDLIAGFFLAADPDIEVGYRIQAAGVQGVVRDIDFRKTRLVDDEGRLHVIPNRLVENAEWIVLGR